MSLSRMGEQLRDQKVVSMYTSKSVAKPLLNSLSVMFT